MVVPFMERAVSSREPSFKKSMRDVKFHERQKKKEYVKETVSK